MAQKGGFHARSGRIVTRGARPQLSRVIHLFTDAACIHARGIAAWGSMLIDGCESHIRSGLIGAHVQCSTTAEAEGVKLALSAFVRGGHIPRGSTVIVHCDNDGVCGYVSGQNTRVRPKANREQFRAAIDEIRNLERLGAIVVTAKWVPSHQQPDTADWRGLINARVDRMARDIARAENKRRISQGDTGRVKKEQQIERAEDGAE
jgi:ribonuclease HI